jgi:hypothetical protein
VINPGTKYYKCVNTTKKNKACAMAVAIQGQASLGIIIM